jgi:hypothetical protein
MTQHHLFNVLRALRTVTDSRPEQAFPWSQPSWSAVLHLALSQNGDAYQVQSPENLAFPKNANHSYRAANQKSKRLPCVIDSIEWHENVVLIEATLNAVPVSLSLDFSPPSRALYRRIAINDPRPSALELANADFVFDAFAQVLRDLSEEWISVEPLQEAVGPQPSADAEWAALSASHQGKYAALLRLTLGHPDLDRFAATEVLGTPNETSDYKDALDRLYLTTIGACIYYLPQPKDRHFNGAVSVAALRALVEDTGYKPTRDHVNPRKRGAQELVNFVLERAATMNTDEFWDYLNTDGVREIYRFCNDHLLACTLVTTQENMFLRNWYLLYPSHEKASAALGIEYFKGLPNRPIERVSEVDAFAMYLRTSPPQQWSVEALEQSFHHYLNQQP